MCLCFLTACGSDVVKNPNQITLEDALKSVGQGLYNLREGEQGLVTGLFADEAEVTFNISASDTTGSKLYVEVSPPATGVPIQGKLGAERTDSLTAQRGNQITIKFKNILSLAKDPKTLEEISAFLVKEQAKKSNDRIINNAPNNAQTQ